MDACRAAVVRGTTPNGVARQHLGPSAAWTFGPRPHAARDRLPDLLVGLAGDRVDAATFVGELALELAVTGEPVGAERSGVDGSNDCTARLDVVLAVAEAAGAGELVDLGER